MSSSNYSYGSGYSDLVKAFTTSEIKELLFGNPLPSFYKTIAHPSSPLQSPPALAPLSWASSVSSDTESVPEAALAFDAFIKGKFDPRLFVPDPEAYFLTNNPPIVVRKKRNRCLPKKWVPMTYQLRPRNSKGRAITSYKNN
ncbi:hypothetical protein O181_112532 [Austropuccinia psidii MF-1]|uniref:Uncharacterized protein n=1 Tax=Austropuccinia psidii MF-1 TaxID=1389203 RepID=A0A9Q3K208_9BASI|nr:hypothetical protein [Austropuccinia psidii MF-1]